MRYSCWLPSLPGCTASSPGGRAKISQPPPASTDSRPSTSRKNARSASGSELSMMVCAPVNIRGGVYRRGRVPTGVASLRLRPGADGGRQPDTLEKGQGDELRLARDVSRLEDDLVERQQVGVARRLGRADELEVDAVPLVVFGPEVLGPDEWLPPG